MRRLVVAILLRYEAVPVWGRWAAALTWAVLLWVQSGRPGAGGPSHPFWNWVTNGAHFGAYGVLCVLVFLAVAARPRTRAILSVAIACAYGILDEVHQGSIPGRDPSIADALSDLFGAVSAAGLLLWSRHQVPRGLWVAAASLACGLGSITWAVLG